MLNPEHGDANVLKLTPKLELDVVMSIVLVSTFGITPKLELKLCSFCIIPDSLLKLKPLT